MKQAVLLSPGQIVFREVEMPEVGEYQVRIKIKAVGICGSDIHIYKGEHPLVTYPVVQGHEFSGIVEKVGAKVTKVAPGDLVTVQPEVGCGQCPKCREGLIEQCENLKFLGASLDGAASEYFVTEEAYLVKLAPFVSAEEASMIEPLAVAVHAVERSQEVCGQTVFVSGAGTIGMLVGAVALLKGAEKVIIADFIEERLKIARKMGMTTVNPQRQDVKEVIEKYSHRKLRTFYECVGNEKSLDTCIENVERGGEIIVLGVFAKPAAVKMLQVQDKEIHMIGSLMYTWENFLEAAQLVEDKKIDLMSICRKTFPFEEWSEAYQYIEEHPEDSVKIIIQL